MAIAVRQVGSLNAFALSNPQNVSLPAPPIADGSSVLVLYGLLRDNAEYVTTPSGWTAVTNGFMGAGGTMFDTVSLFYRVCTNVSQQTVSVASTGGGVSGHYVMVELSEADVSTVQVGAQSSAYGTAWTLAGVTPTPGLGAVILGGIAQTKVTSSTPASGWTEEYDAVVTGSFHPTSVVVSKTVASASGAYSPAGFLGLSENWCGIAIAFSSGGIAPVADFDAVPTITETNVAIAFEDLSTGNPTSWAWDFGDGTTSTSQNPIKSGYTSPGVYTVSLTATNAFGSDVETKTSYISVTVAGAYDPPIPAGVLLEIYASEPGAAKWDVAKWDEAVWSTAGWRDVTPYGVEVNITWGSNRPELGILSVPTAGNWTVDYYDPDRILDPANEDGPYFGDLVPFLPIRVSHRETIVRVGYVTGISHNYAPGTIAGTGYMRGTDNISRMANAMVPSDTELSDTLHLRALDAIAAAGLNIHVRPPRVTSPAVSPWITGTREWSVWDWIKDAAQEVLYVPFVDRWGNLDFRQWSDPLVRARSLASPELIDLAVVTDWSGLFSVVQAREDVDTVIERALTPPPRYGARTYTRDEITIDPGDWAAAVLADRGLNNLLWKPGDVRPLTALSTEQLATIENVERIGLTLIEQTPPVIAAGIVVGGEITIIGKKDDEAVWRFRYELAQTATEPLIETGGEPTDYLLRTGGGEYLYPTGGA